MTLSCIWGNCSLWTVFSGPLQEGTITNLFTDTTDWLFYAFLEYFLSVPTPSAYALSSNIFFIVFLVLKLKILRLQLLFLVLAIAIGFSIPNFKYFSCLCFLQIFDYFREIKSFLRKFFNFLNIYLVILLSSRGTTPACRKLPPYSSSPLKQTYELWRPMKSSTYRSVLV